MRVDTQGVLTPRGEPQISGSTLRSSEAQAWTPSVKSSAFDLEMKILAQKKSGNDTVHGGDGAGKHPQDFRGNGEWACDV